MFIRRIVRHVGKRTGRVHGHSERKRTSCEGEPGTGVNEPVAESTVKAVMSLVRYL